LSPADWVVTLLLDAEGRLLCRVIGLGLFHSDALLRLIERNLRAAA
jgi:hypothetical protein